MSESDFRIDRDAPIVPAESAAGVRLDDQACYVVQGAGLTYVEDPPHRVRRYPLGCLALWTKQVG